MNFDRGTTLSNAVSLVERGSGGENIKKLIAPVGALLQGGVESETGTVIELDSEAHCFRADP